MDFEIHTDEYAIEENCREIEGLLFDLGSAQDRELLEAVLLECLSIIDGRELDEAA